MIAIGRAPSSAQELADRFYWEYEQDRLNFDEFLRFQLDEFVGNDIKEMADLAKQHFDSVVIEKIYPEAEDMIYDQLASGDMVCMLTATNSVIAKPLADYLGIENLIATELALENGRYTGEISGTYCCAEGKLVNLQAYLDEHQIDIQAVTYYGDSLSDKHVLAAVGHAVAVNPMPALLKLAQSEGWDIMNFSIPDE